jgi:predicted ATP-dependent endonuclease of OLD family
MKLAKVAFEDVMELEGSIAFPEGKAVVIYGENKAGKSNIIHALRYAFLSKVIKSRRSSGYDESTLVTGKEMAPSEGVGKISIEFEHDGKQFEIHREIDRYKDNNKILRKEADGFHELDFGKTLDKELKAGLLDALFAPDSAMGFNHLNEKNIDAVIRELFKEIGNAKVLTTDFKQRIQKLREEASARFVGIERDYNSFIAHLKDELREVPLDLSRFERYEFGRTSEKIGDVADALKRYVDSLEKGELKEWIGEMRKRAQDAEDVEKLLGKDAEIRNSFQKMEQISQDREHLNLLVAGLREVKLGGPMPQEPGKFYDSELDKRAEIIYQELKDAQTNYSNALELAQEEKIDFKIDNPARIKSDKEKVLKLLTRELLTGDAPRVRADLVKIDNSVKAHG